MLLAPGTSFFGGTILRRSAHLQPSIEMAFTDFKKLLQVASSTGNFLPAVNEAQKWLDSTDFRTKKSPMEITSCIKVFDRAGLADDAARVIDVVLERGGTVNAFHYNAAITSLKHHKRYSQAVALFERMQRGNHCAPDHYTTTAMISVFSETKEWDRAYALFRQASDHDTVMKAAILQCSARCGQVETLTSLFDSFKAPRTHAMFHAMLAGLGSAGRWQHAVDTYHLMLNEIGPDEIARYNIVRILQQHGQADLAATYGSSTSPSSVSASASSMRSKESIAASPTPSSSISLPLTDLLREARRSGDYRIAVDAAETWLQSKRNVAPSPGGLQVVIQIFGEARRADRVVDLLEDMENQVLRQPDRPPSLRNFNAMLVALVKCGKPDVSLSVFNRMRDKDSYSYGAALLAYEKKGNWQAAQELFLSLDRPNSNAVSANRGVEKTAPMYNTLLSCLAKAGQWQSMLERFREMGPKADRVSRAIVLQGLGRAGQVELLAEMRQELLGGVVDATEGTLRNSTRARKNRIQENEGNGEDDDHDEDEDDNDDEEEGELVSFDGVLRRMPMESKAGTLLQKLSEKPAQGGIFSVAKFYAIAGHIDEAIDVLDKLEAAEQTDVGAQGKNSTARMSTYNEILLALGTTGDWERAFMLFQRMVQNNVPRSLTTYQAVTHVMNEFGDEEAADMVKQQMLRDGVRTNGN